MELSLKAKIAIGIFTGLFILGIIVVIALAITFDENQQTEPTAQTTTTSSTTSSTTTDLWTTTTTTTTSTTTLDFSMCYLVSNVSYINEEICRLCLKKVKGKVLVQDRQLCQPCSDLNFKAYSKLDICAPTSKRF